MAIYYGDGSNSNTGRVIKVSYADSSAYGRTSVSATSSGGEGGQRTLWTALTHSKVSSTSHLRCQMHIQDGKYHIHIMVLVLELNGLVVIILLFMVQIIVLVHT